jgi:hypothetical protein
MPTVQITAASIEDAMIPSDIYANNNYGGSTGLIVGCGNPASRIFRFVIRLDETEIPEGTLTGFRLELTRTSHANSQNSNTMEAFIIKSANDWVEGSTPGGAPEVGACCWNYAKYNTQSWAGSAGCSTSGTDYDADASPPSLAYSSYTSGSDVAMSFELDPDWATAWRDGRANEGILCKANDEVTALSQIFFHSADGTTPPYFEIDYGSRVFMVSF